MIDRVRRQLDALSARTLIVVATVTVALPLVVAVIALAQRRWYPVLDLAMTEFRIRDVGTRQTPLIGLPGRIGELPDQGSHPGPLSFWLLAPAYRLFGGSAWAMEVATVSVALVWIGLAMWIGHRRLGRSGIALVAAIIALLTRGFGLSVLTQPWNPYMPLLAWLVVLLAAWAVLDGDDMMLIPLVAAASFAAQTHIPYLLMAGAIGLLAVGVVLVRWWRARSSEERASPATQCPRDDRRVRRALAGTARRPASAGPGQHHASSRPLRVPGRGADRIRRRHPADASPSGRRGRPSRTPRGTGTIPRGGFRSRRSDLGRGDRPRRCGSWRSLSRFASGTTPWSRSIPCSPFTLVLTTMSMSRIFGQRWYYLTLWAWVTTTLLVVATLWTAVVWLRSRDSGHRRVPHPSPHRRHRSASAAVVLTASMIVLAPSTDHPEEYLGDTLGELVEPTAAALDPDGTYVVEWKDAYFFGSQAFGLVNELRRAGYDVGAGEFWTVPITASRVVPTGTADSALVFVTGGFVEQWRADDRFVELATVDPRSPDELVEFERLRAQLIAELETQRARRPRPAGRHESVRAEHRSTDQRIGAHAQRRHDPPRPGNRRLPRTGGHCALRSLHRSRGPVGDRR